MTESPCAWCGQPARGFATISTDDEDVRYCHDGPSPTCYEQASGDGVADLLAREWG